MTGKSGTAGTLRQNQMFLQTIFGSEWQRAHICAVQGDPAKDGGNWAGGPASRVLEGAGDNTNNYFCVSLFHGTRRRINEFEKLMCLAIDDIGPKLDADLAELLLGPPTWIVETSRGNFQWGYRLEDPIIDADAAGELIHRVRVALTGEKGKDPGQEGVTRYMRLPTGVNLKSSLRFRAWKVRLVKCEKTIGLSRKKIEEIFGASATNSSVTTTSDSLSQDNSAPGDRGAGAVGRSSKNKKYNLYEQDAIFRALDKLGLVLGGPRDTAMGWGFDIRCPWVEEHTDRAETGTVYVAGAGKFKCQHGHCADRTVADLRLRVNEQLRDAGHTGGLIEEEFDAVDPVAAPLPPQGTRPKIETDFFNRFAVLLGRNLFYDLHTNHETTAADIDAGWTYKLLGVLPQIKQGKILKPLPPSRWLREDKRCHKVNGLMGCPGLPRVTAPDPAYPQRLYVNTWEPMERPLKGVDKKEVDAKAIAPWLNVFWHVVGCNDVEQWEIGETILDWMALVLGDTSIKGGWQVLLMGQQGLGKDTIMLPIATTLGRWAQTVQSQQFGADFNEWAGGRLVMVNETRQNTRGALTGHDVMNVLKSVFDNTRHWLTVNAKYMPKYYCRNVVMGWFTSNERDPLRLDPGDRRFLVLDREGTKPLDSTFYAQLHDWLDTSPMNSSITGTMRVAEFMFRRWDNMDKARRKILLGIAPMTPDKQALLNRLIDPVEDWMQRSIARGPADPLTFPDIVTAGYVHSRLFTAIKTGGEGLPGGVTLPNLVRIGQGLKAAGAVALNNGKQIKVKGWPVILWAVRNFTSYKMLQPQDLAKLYLQSVGGTSTGTIN